MQNFKQNTYTWVEKKRDRARRFSEDIWEQEKPHFLHEWNQCEGNQSFNKRVEEVTEVLKQPFKDRHHDREPSTKRQWGRQASVWVREQTDVQNTTVAATQSVAPIAPPAHSDPIFRNTAAAHGGHTETELHMSDPSYHMALEFDSGNLNFRPEFFHYPEGFSWLQQNQDILSGENQLPAAFASDLQTEYAFWENTVDPYQTSGAPSAVPGWPPFHMYEQQDAFLLPDVAVDETRNVLNSGANVDVDVPVARAPRPIGIYGAGMIPNFDITPAHDFEEYGGPQMAFDAHRGPQISSVIRDDAVVVGQLCSSSQTPGGESMLPPNSGSPKKSKKRSRQRDSLIARSETMMKRLSDTIKRWSLGSPETKQSPDSKRLRLDDC